VIGRGISRSRIIGSLNLCCLSRCLDADLLLGLTLQILVGTESKSAADQNDGVEPDAHAGTVAGRSGCGGLRVALGLGVALLLCIVSDWAFWWA
jgi:hypothetical protein